MYIDSSNQRTCQIQLTTTHLMYKCFNPSTDLNDQEDVTVRVSNTEYTLSRQGGHCSLIIIVVQHVIDLTGIAVKVETLRYLTMLTSIIKGHRGKDGLYLQIKSEDHNNRKLSHHIDGRYMYMFMCS